MVYRGQAPDRSRADPTRTAAIGSLPQPVLLPSQLDFEADVLDGIEDGFRGSGGAIPVAAEVDVKTSVQIQASGGASTGAKWGIPLNPFGSRKK